ncbi:MAG: thiamine-phosphate kinase [Pseudomonadota bacterium]
MKISERNLIDIISKGSLKRARGLLCGIGDDAAVIEAGEGRAWLISTDALFEGVHFDLGYTTPKKLGRKSLNVNLSDIAAMGGVPKFFLVSIGIPKTIDEGFVKSLYASMAECGREHGVELIGGDTSSSKSDLVISVTIIGEAKSGSVVFRSGARSGDSIFVSGMPGFSALGLEMLKRRIKKPSMFIEKHLDPTPQLKLGKWLADTGIVNSMIDVSDGLILDLDRIAQCSKVGYIVEIDKIVKDKKFDEVAGKMRLSREELILSGGEDYSLLFTVGKRNRSKFLKLLKQEKSFCDTIYEIGRITDASTKKAVDSKGRTVKLPKLGFDHFL